jgi:hypothetical protein
MPQTVEVIQHARAAQVSIRIRQHTSGQHTSAYVSIRQVIQHARAAQVPLIKALSRLC